VQQRGAAISGARLIVAASGANAVVDTVRSLIMIRKEDWPQLALCSTGEYGVENGLIAVPVQVKMERAQVVQNVNYDSAAENRLQRKRIKRKISLVQELLGA